MTWYEKYGWNSNPFEVIPMPDTIAGIKEIRKEIVDYINSGDCCLLTGEDGIGKTVVLKWLEKYTSPNTLTIYLNTLGMTAEELKKINIDEIIREGSKKSLFRKKKKIIFLIDDANTLPSVIASSIKRNFDNKNISAIILAADTDELPNLEGNLLELIGNRKIQLRPLVAEEAREMIDKRIKYRNPFEPGSLEPIFKKADYNPRNILELCEMIARENEENTITKYFVEKAFGKKEEVKVSKTEIIDKLSPLQKDIVNILKKGDFTPSEIAKKLKKPTKTITSQIAYLCLKSGVGVMRRKGIEQPIVEKVSEDSSVYTLTDYVR
jgi:Cdc6-like AAA superfamily ATPase